MTGPAPEVAAVRLAVRAVLTDLPPWTLVLIGCSGGPDSLALAAGVAFEAPRLGLRAGAVVVDHGLQASSDEVAGTAAAHCRRLGLDPVDVVRVQVAQASSGPEEAARQARYAALEESATRHTAALVLLGHTRDDQAEQVLLGLARGSGARSLAGMPPARGRYRRPLLGVTRAQTEAACAAAGLTPWRDPHNADSSYARVRARQALEILDGALGPGLPAALARSADLLREDAELLDGLAGQARASLGQPHELDAEDLAALPAALRRRVWRIVAAEAGARALTSRHVELVDALVTGWRGQGPVDLPGGVVARRSGRMIGMMPRS